MPHSIGRLARLVAALLVVACLGITASAVAQPDNGSNGSGKRYTAQSSVVKDCAYWTKATRFAAVRVKKVAKRVRNGELPYWKYKASVRLYHQILRNKNRVCSSEQPAGPPAPLALTAQEVANRVFSLAAAYCDVDPYCYQYGSYSTSTCASQTTYQWTCYGYNDETYGDRCDFREVVSRSGYDGITSSQDLSYGTNGWNCY